MGKKKILISVMVLGILCCVLSGCGSVKSAWLAARMGAAVKRTPITGVGGRLTGSLQGKTLGMDSEVHVTLDFDSSGDSQGNTYSSVKGKTRVQGVDLQTNYEIYGVPEEKGCSYYVHVEKPDLWAVGRSKIGGSRLMKLDPALFTVMFERTSQSATVEKQGESYALRLEFTPGDLPALLEGLGTEFPENLTAEEISQLRIPVELRISAKTYLPERFRLDLEGLSGPMLKEIFRHSGWKLLGTEPETGTCSLEFTAFRYHTGAIPTLPEGAREKAADIRELEKVIQKLPGWS